MPGEVAGHFSLERLNTLNTIMRYAAEFSSTHQKGLMNGNTNWNGLNIAVNESWYGGQARRVSHF